MSLHSDCFCLFIFIIIDNVFTLSEVITLDWLQLHVRQVQEQYGPIMGRFTILKAPGQTKQFKHIYSIYEGKEKVATMVGRPHSGILKPDSGLMKIENRFLYTDTVKELVTNLLEDLQLAFKNISRLDIACDFNQFMNNLSPERFIHRFAFGDYVKLMKTKFNIHGMHRRTNTFEYIRFGSNTSTLCYYLYNKSIEMREKTNKPYITENWRNKGLDLEREIWRLEFSIHSNPRGLVYGDTGEVVPFSKLDVLDYYQDVYRGLFHRYFDFRKEDGQAKKERMKKIPLLELEKPSANIMRLVPKLDSNRMDKIFMKMLIGTNAEMREINFEVSNKIAELIKYYSDSRELETYLRNKFPDYYEKFYVTPDGEINSTNKNYKPVPHESKNN